MRALATLAVRLARAGGAFRFASIALGNAIAMVLILFALGLPEAAWPVARERAANAVNITLVLVALVVPAIVLLITVGRLSSGVRDRRLASLRLIGLSPARTRLVAALENAVLAVAGIAVGAGAFAVLAPVVGDATLGGAGPLPGSLAVPGGRTALAGLGLLALSVVVGTAPTWNDDGVRDQRSEAAARRPRAWRLLVLAAAVAVFAWVLTLDGRFGTNPDAIAGYFAGVVLGVVGVAVATPLITSWIATLTARRTRSTAVRLGARATETDTLSSARVVAGLAVAVFLASAALGFLGMVAGARHTAVALRADGDGPRAVAVGTLDGTPVPDPLRDPAHVAGLFSGVPGVRGAVPVRPTFLPAGGSLVAPVFVGTCAELALAEQVQGFTVTGCDDTSPAWIVTDDGRTRWDVAGDAPGHHRPALPVGSAFEVRLGWSQDDPSAGTFTPSGTAIAVSGRTVAASQDPVAFVPAALVAARLDGGLDPFTRVDVVADGGPAALEEVAARAASAGLAAFDVTEHDLTAFQQVRAVVYGLAAVAITVAVLTVALASVDRTRERRHNVARQAMIGVPRSVLGLGQAIQVAFPALVAAGLALAVGALSVRVMAHITGEPALVAARTWATIVGVVVAGIAVVALATLPLTRTRLTAELLRRE